MYLGQQPYGVFFQVSCYSHVSFSLRKVVGYIKKRSESMKKVKMSKSAAIKYLKRVSVKWTAFCRSHKRFITAISVLLDEVENN